MAEENLLDSKKSSECINDRFPNEILEKIFLNLPQRYICTVRQVCQRWKVIVDEVIGHSIVITSFSTLAHFLPPEESRKFFPIDIRTLRFINEHNIAIRHLTIGWPGMLISDAVPDLLDELMKKLESIPKPAFPHVLQSLSCFEPIPSDLLTPTMLNSFIKLKRLNISLFSLSSLRVKKSFRAKQIFQSLEALEISDTPTYALFDSSSAIPALNKLLGSVEVPNLISLKVCYPILTLLHVEGDCTESVAHFAMKVAKSLRKLSVSIRSPSQNFLPLPKQFEYPKDLLEEMEELGKNLDLEELEVNDNHLHSLRPSTQVKAWMALAKQQSNLRALKLHLKSSIEFKEDVVPILERNGDTLRLVKFSCFPSEICKDSGDVYFIPIDCRCFTTCTKLEKLLASDKLIHLEHLPSSLKYVYIDAALSIDDAHHLLCSPQNLPNLERVELKDARGGSLKGFGYGVSISTIQKFVEIRKVKRLIVYSRCTDGKFPEEGIYNGDPRNEKRLHKRKVNPDSILSSFEDRHLPELIRIDWILNDNGFYEEAPRSILIDDDERDCDKSTGNSSFYTRRLIRVRNGNSGGREIQHSLFSCDRLFSSYQ